MRPGHSIAIAIACCALAGCGGAPLSTEATVPDTTPHGSPPQTLLSLTVEKERSEKAFEAAYRTRYVVEKKRGVLTPASIRFRTPCQPAGARSWKCEGWGLDRLKRCIFASALVSGTGVVGTLEEMVLTSSEAGYAVCSNGANEGKPFGDLTPEP